MNDLKTERLHAIRGRELKLVLDHRPISEDCKAKERRCQVNACR